MKCNLEGRHKCFGKVKFIYYYEKEYQLCPSHALTMESKFEHNKEFRDELLLNYKKKQRATG